MYAGDIRIAFPTHRLTDLFHTHECNLTDETFIVRLGNIRPKILPPDHQISV